MKDIPIPFPAATDGLEEERKIRVELNVHADE